LAILGGVVLKVFNAGRQTIRDAKPLRFSLSCIAR
jgi:hypothetical protein